MRSAVILMIIVSSILALSPYSYADDKTRKQMSFIFDGEFKGPFEDTQIVRLKDPKYDVVCYLYIPTFVSTSYIYSGGKGGTAFKSFTGNISCVRVKGSLW